MRGAPFETVADDQETSTPIPMGFVVVVMVLFAALAAYYLGPNEYWTQ